MTQINANDLRYLISLAEHDRNHVISKPCINGLKLLVEGKDDNHLLDLFDRNSLVACKLWQNEDFISKAHEIIEEIPLILEDKLPIHKEIEKIATDAAKKNYTKYLSECTDGDWNCIEEAIHRELTENYANKYDRNLRVQIKCIYPDGSDKICSGICDELTHRIECLTLDTILTTARDMHTPRSLFKFYVLKSDIAENRKDAERTPIVFPLYHIDDITEEMMNSLTPEEQEKIYYVQ